MGGYNFGAASEKTLKKLIETIEENNKLTSDHNDKMLGYNRWLRGLTIAILFLTIVLVALTTAQVYNAFK